MNGSVDSVDSMDSVDSNLENVCIIQREHYLYIWRVSFLSFFSSVYAIYCGYYDLAVVPGGVFLTSTNYWRRPVYGWRRNLDMGYVACALTYQNYRAYYMLWGYWYYLLMLFSLGCYPANIYLYKKKDFWGSTYVHCLLHVIANIANVVLYGGGDGGGGIRDRKPPVWSAAAFCPCSDAPLFG